VVPGWGAGGEGRGTHPLTVATAASAASGPDPLNRVRRCYGGRVPAPILLCTDGSDLAVEALSAGLALLGRDHQLVLVTVSDAPDPAALVGSGHAGAELTPKQYEQRVADADGSARAAIDAARSALGLADAEARVVQGDPGEAICRVASELSAAAIVIGSRGRGGLKRAFLGSVSDHVVRNAPCSVIVTGARAAPPPG